MTAVTKTPKAAKGKGKGAKEKTGDAEDCDSVEGDDEMSELTHSQAGDGTGNKDTTDDNAEELVVEA